MNTVSTIDSPGDDPGADRIVFYADPISPYVYIACHRLAQLQAGRPALRIDVAPVLLAGLLGHFGQLGPASAPCWCGSCRIRRSSASQNPT